VPAKRDDHGFLGFAQVVERGSFGPVSISSRV
jgi:hypothetical protein